ncbi:hypothetical protein WA026_019406 [Henosepilachna vigintioctopunctata]|uniref:Uncharacterized protein n=1 Tax=Henosepilachna vigintioctopunctata TaxID=420089 RepID=A0AAW1UCT1_9CUCU
MLQKYSNEQWQQKIEQLSTENGDIWKMTRALEKDKIKIPPLHGLNGMIYTDDEKVEEIANQLKNQCRSSYVRADLDVIEHVNREMRIFMNEETDKEIRNANIEEVTNIIKGNGKRKALGPDGIPCIAVTELPPMQRRY